MNISWNHSYNATAAGVYAPSEPQAAGQAAAPDLGGLIAILVPFLLFLILLYWGLGKRNRKKRAIELSYNLIALELLLLLLLPSCSRPFSCLAFLLLPVVMFGMLILFMLHRTRREKQHKRRLADALAKGHVELSGLLQGRLEEEISKRLEGKSREQKPKKQKPGEKSEWGEEGEAKAGGKTERPGTAAPSPTRRRSAHRKIDGIFDKVFGKGEKGAPSKKKGGGSGSKSKKKGAKGKKGSKKKKGEESNGR